MKINKFVFLKPFVLATLVAVGMASCSKNQSGVSKATGWKIDGRDGRYNYNHSFKKQATPFGMVAIEGGTFTKGKVQDDPMHDWNNTPTQQHVQSFFMDETEVTNMMYTEYLFYLKKTFSPTEENYKNIYFGALPDTLVWRDRLGYNESMVTMYLWHPSYGEYPVVGVNWVQATHFCQWRTNFAQMTELEKERYLKKDAKSKELSDVNYFSRDGYIMSPSTTFGGNDDVVKKKLPRGARSSDQDVSNVYATVATGVIIAEYRLPTEVEWEYAATALNEKREYNLYRGKKKYPWNGSYTRSGKRKDKGDQLANYKQGKGDYGGPAGWSSDGGDITVRVKSFPPNAFGLYDTAGNVNEWVADVYRPIVDDEMNDFNYFRGNIYTKSEIGEDGQVRIINVDDIEYETLPNGKQLARVLPGQVSKVPVDEDETYLRTNFDRSDVRNYRDGDPQSQKDYYLSNSEDENDKRMYNSPKHRAEVLLDTLTGEETLNREWDSSNKRTTLVDDNSRVYKGGSWKDRAYWLDPAQRRYSPQYIATNDIGFRCVVSKLGEKSNKKKARG